MPLLNDDWPILGKCLAVPAHEIAAARSDEPTLFLKITRLLDFWVSADSQNDRHRLVTALFDAPHNLANVVSRSLQKAD